VIQESRHMFVRHTLFSRFKKLDKSELYLILSFVVYLNKHNPYIAFFMVPTVMRRIESPSSINTYKQCPRKYFYQYIEELETSPSIHLIRGKIAHSVLEDFFKLDINKISKNYDFEFKIILHDLLGQHWRAAKEELSTLGLTDSKVNFYLEETKQMIQFWLLDLLQNLNCLVKENSLANAFDTLRPRTELYLCSKKHGVQGYIDAVHEIDGKIKLIDYKTSKRDHINDAYRLQLAIYALLYEEEYGKRPDEVGIHFLKFCEKSFCVDEKLTAHASSECSQMHKNTVSDDMHDYPKNKTPLCKWHSGQCDFFNECNKNQG